MSRTERQLRTKAAASGVDYDAHDSVRSLAAAIAARETLRESAELVAAVAARTGRRS